MSKVKSKRMVKTNKRSIVCNECKKLLPHTHYTWYKKSHKNTEIISSSTKWTLNSRTCKKCIAKHQNVVNRLKKEIPYPKNNKCDCCGKKSEFTLQLDHSHSKSLKFRGWLCRNCNTGIGMLGDSIIGLKRAVRYLQKVK